MPELTVLMPVYNGQTYLREAISSILTQTYKDYEFLIIDDGSVDDSEDIILSYDDKRIKYVKNDRNRGLEFALNRGMELASSPYIARMDCDDVSLPRRFEIQMEFLKNKPDVAVCGTWVETFGAFKDIWPYAKGHDEIKCELLFDSHFSHPSVILNREAFIKKQLFYDSDYSVASDYELWSRVPDDLLFANIEHVLLRYRIHESQSVSYSQDKMIKGANAVRRKLLRALSIDTSEDNVMMHFHVAKGILQRDMSFLDKANDWLLHILQANEKARIYNQELLKKVAAKKWWYTCQNATSMGLQSVVKCYRSPFYKYIQATTKEKVKFFVKSAILWKG